MLDAQRFDSDVERHAERGESGQEIQFAVAGAHAGQYHGRGTRVQRHGRRAWHVPQPPRQRYSWEDEDEADDTLDDAETLEPPRPYDVPVLWHRQDPPTGVVLPFRPRPAPARDEGNTPP